MKCSKCGGHVRGSSGKTNGVLNLYYHCTNHKCKERIKVPIAKDLFVQKLTKMSTNEVSIRLFEKMMKAYHKQTIVEKSTGNKEIVAALVKN
ncbi:MAG: hypothetical protein QM530_05570 [Phycisphaerales bacterium]|nr:hypothetical protein [Phycisphaerales bacterium]